MEQIKLLQILADRLRPRIEAHLSQKPNKQESDAQYFQRTLGLRWGGVLLGEIDSFLKGKKLLSVQQLFLISKDTGISVDDMLKAADYAGLLGLEGVEVERTGGGSVETRVHIMAYAAGDYNIEKDFNSPGIWVRKFSDYGIINIDSGLVFPDLGDLEFRSTNERYEIQWAKGRNGRHLKLKPRVYEHKREGERVAFLEAITKAQVSWLCYSHPKIGRTHGS